MNSWILIYFVFYSFLLFSFSMFKLCHFRSRAILQVGSGVLLTQPPVISESPLAFWYIIHPYNNPKEIDTVVICVLQLTKLSIAQGHKAMEGGTGI